MPSFISVRLPAAGPWPAMVRINNAAGYAAGHTAAMVVDDYLPGSANAISVIPDGMEIWAKNAAQGNAIQFLGIQTGAGATASRVANGGGLKFAVADNDELYVVDPANLAFTLASGRGFVLADPASFASDLSEDGRGNIIWYFYDIA